MTPIVVTGSAIAAGLESFQFAGVEWNDLTTFQMESFDPGIAPKRWRWVTGADSDGALSADEAHYDNAEMNIRIRVVKQASMDAALDQIGNLVLALQECEKQPLGQAGVWTPATSTKSLTAYVVGGEVLDLPKTWDGADAGYWASSPVITLKLYRRPFLYGAEVTNAATVTNTNRFQIVIVPNVSGDVDGEGRLSITDGASQSRRHVEWGLEQRYYDAATNLSIDTFVTSGFAGTSTTRSGSFNTNVIRGTLTTTPVAICGLGNLSHVGTFRVKLRCYAAPTSTSVASDFKVRLSWREGDGPLRSNDWVSPVVVNNWSEIDLGTISIPPKELGTQRWTGQIEAYSAAVADTLDVDYALPIPTEAYGKARAPLLLATPSAFSARDEFDQTAGALSGKTLPVGGTWSGAGDADDFSVDATNHWVKRAPAAVDAANTGRFAIAGTTVFTDSATSAAIQVPAGSLLGVSAFNRYAVAARYTDTNNWLIAAVESLPSTGGSGYNIVVRKRVAGTVSAPLAIANVSPLAAAAFMRLTLIVTATGAFGVFYAPEGSATSTLVCAGSDSALATGGALASGKIGIYEEIAVTNAPAAFDSFTGWQPNPDAVVFSGRAAEIRHDSAIRQDSTGTYYGPIQTYRGARFFLPPAGSANRTSRIFVKTRRNDVDTVADDQIADSTTVTVSYRPRYYVAPR